MSPAAMACDRLASSSLARMEGSGGGGDAIAVSGSPAAGGAAAGGDLPNRREKSDIMGACFGSARPVIAHVTCALPACGSRVRMVEFVRQNLPVSVLFTRPVTVLVVLRMPVLVVRPVFDGIVVPALVFLAAIALVVLLPVVAVGREHDDHACAAFPLELLRVAARARAHDLVALLVPVMVRLVAGAQVVDVAIAQIYVDVSLPLRERAGAGLALLRLAVLADLAVGLPRSASANCVEIAAPRVRTADAITTDVFIPASADLNR